MNPILSGIKSYFTVTFADYWKTELVYRMWERTFCD